MTAGGGGTEAYRLPRTVEPETYHIEIEPNVASATFSGTLAIDAVVREPIDVVVMNAAELVVSDVEIRTADGRRWPAQFTSTTISNKCRSGPRPRSHPGHVSSHAASQEP